MRAEGDIGQVPTNGSVTGKSEKANEPTHLVIVVQVADVALSRDHGERGGERRGAQGHAHDGHRAKYARRRHRSATRGLLCGTATRAWESNPRALPSPSKSIN
jgi:hypothetical protein